MHGIVNETTEIVNGTNDVVKQEQLLWICVSIPPHVRGHLLGTNQLGRVGVSLGGHAPCHSNPPLHQPDCCQLRKK